MRVFLGVNGVNEFLVAKVKIIDILLHAISTEVI